MRNKTEKEKVNEKNLIAKIDIGINTRSEWKQNKKERKKERKKEFILWEQRKR